MNGRYVFALCEKPAVQEHWPSEITGLVKTLRSRTGISCASGRSHELCNNIYFIVNLTLRDKQNEVLGCKDTFTLDNTTFLHRKLENAVLPTATQQSADHQTLPHIDFLAAAMFACLDWIGLDLWPHPL